MDVMGTRRKGLQESLVGLQKTGESLISIRDGQLLIGQNTDDLGAYYFIPRLANSLNLSIDVAINVFYGGLILLAFAVAFFWILKSLKFSRQIIYPSILLISISIIAFAIGDVYTASFFSVFFLTPIFLMSLSNKKLWIKIILFVFIGIVIGFSNFIRSQAALATLIFIFSYLLLSKRIIIKYKIYLSVSLLVGLMIFNLFTNCIFSKRDLFLSTKGVKIEQSNNHVFWHSLYIGLGYLDNEYGIKYKDNIAKDKVSSIDITVEFCSEQYEQLLKNEFFSLIKKDPKFFISTILAKSGVTLLLFLLFSNTGLYYIFLNRKEFPTLIPFVLSLGFSSLPAVLVMPLFSYLIGFLSLTVFMSIFYYLKNYSP